MSTDSTIPVFKTIKGLYNSIIDLSSSADYGLNSESRYCRYQEEEEEEESNKRTRDSRTFGIQIHMQSDNIITSFESSSHSKSNTTTSSFSSPYSSSYLSSSPSSTPCPSPKPTFATSATSSFFSPSSIPTCEHQSSTHHHGTSSIHTHPSTLPLDSQYMNYIYEQLSFSEVQFPEFQRLFKDPKIPINQLEYIATVYKSAYRMISGSLGSFVRNNSALLKNYRLLSQSKDLDEDIFFDQTLSKGGIHRSSSLSTPSKKRTIIEKWRVLSLSENTEGLGCLAFSTLNTNINNNSAQHNTTTPFLLRSELFCLLALLARQVDPRFRLENWKLDIQDYKKGNGWVGRSANSIFITRSHFRVVEAKLLEGTFDQPKVHLHINVLKSISWDQMKEEIGMGIDGMEGKSGGDEGGGGGQYEYNYEEIWKFMLAWSLMSRGDSGLGGGLVG